MMPQTWNKIDQDFEDIAAREMVHRRPYRLLPWFLRALRDLSRTRIASTVFSAQMSERESCPRPT